MLWAAAGLAGLLLFINRLGIRHPLPYLGISTGLWYAVLLSGVHATIAGVLAAFTIPAHSRLHPWFLAHKLRQAAKTMDEIDPQKPQDQILADDDKHAVLESVEQRARATRTPLRSWENAMDRPVSLLVVPSFAFLNAGIEISGEMFQTLASSPISWGVITGLVLGKPLGIVLMFWLTIKLGWGGLPEEVELAHLVGLSLLAGMDFTMSIFIATLSFGNQPELLTEAKASIMLATAVAGLIVIVWLWFLPHRKMRSNNPQY